MLITEAGLLLISVTELMLISVAELLLLIVAVKLQNDCFRSPHQKLILVKSNPQKNPPPARFHNKKSGIVYMSPHRDFFRLLIIKSDARFSLFIRELSY